MKKNNTVQDVFSRLRDQILTFKLLPGVRVSDKEVAEELGLSRTPVREALIHLAEQGLVEARPNRGFTVKVFSIKEVEDLYTLRAALEKLAINLTTRRMDAEKAEHLQKILDKYPPLMEAQDIVGFNDADEAFHDLIACYSENKPLHQNLRSLQGQIRVIRRYDHLRSSSFQETYVEHQGILNSMILGESEKAEEDMSRHILHSMDIIIKILEQT
ncbi:MAG: GntR family transcriptional regulator [Pseudomonadota bacterium]